MPVLRVLAVGFFLLAACGGREAPRADPGTGSEDAADAGYEMRGVYRCCAKGTGKACCEGVPRSPSGSAMCFQYGGLYGDCRAAGELYEGKVLCAGCCDGLERSSMVEPGDEVPPELDGLPEGCDETAPPSILVCIRCGDGICGAGENFCNCLADCPRPESVADAGADGD
jgi:hypothetical protein